MIKEIKELFFPIVFMFNQFMKWLGYTNSKEVKEKMDSLQERLDISLKNENALEMLFDDPNYPNKTDDKMPWHQFWVENCQHLNIRGSIFKIGKENPILLQNLLVAISDLDLGAIQTYMKKHDWTWGGSTVESSGYYPEKADLVETIFELAKYNGAESGGFSVSWDPDNKVTIRFDGKNFNK